MPQYDYDVGIIGGGAAGLTVAAGVSRLGAKTILIEREGRLGGDCLHYGCVPSKTLLRTAHVYHLMKNADRFGLPEVRPAPVDFRAVSSRIREVIAAIQRHDSVERFCELGVKVEFGMARFTDEHTVSCNGNRVTARNWVIATGSSPAVPDVVGIDRTPFITNKELFYLHELPRSLIVIGAGAVAVEMAQAMSRLGSKVDVIQRSGQILSKEDRDMADEVMASLEREGVTFHVNTMLTEVRDCGQVRQVAFENGDGHPVTLEADSILVALGRVANIAGLGLEDAGVHCSRKGIEVDARLRTSQKHIYAAGDVTGSHQYTHAAGYEGGVVLTNAVLRLPRKTDYTWFPHAIYCDPEFASIGLNEKAAEKAGIDHMVWKEEFRDNDRSLAEGYDGGVLKMIVDKRENVLGVQILGPHAGELINEWVAVLNGRVRLSTLAGAVHPYPTLGEINKRIAGDVFAQKLFSESVKKRLKFFFNLKGRACESKPKFPAA